MLIDTYSASRHHTHHHGIRHWLWTIGTWFARTRQRQALRALDSRLLDDIGVTEDERRKELATPFWR